MLSPQRIGRVVRTALQVAFWLATAGWYVLLVRPAKAFTDAVAGWEHQLIYLAQKGLHFGVYAGLAAGAVALFGRRRWWVLGLVMAHGILSELGQYLRNLWFDTHRSGDPVDVLIDWAGVAVGVSGWWVANRRRFRRTPTARSGVVGLATHGPGGPGSPGTGP